MISIPLPVALLAACAFYWLGSCVGRFIGRQEASLHALILIKGFGRRKSLVYPDLLQDFVKYMNDIGRDVDQQ